MTHITSQYGKVTVFQHQATKEEQLNLELAIGSFGYLLLSMQPIAQVKQFTFAQFAEMIQAHYSMLNPQVAVVVNSLLSLHQSN